MFKISYSLDFLNNVSFVNIHHAMAGSTKIVKSP